jgi:hypothetical protein
MYFRGRTLMNVKLKDVIKIASETEWWNDCGVYKARSYKYEFSLSRRQHTVGPDTIAFEVRNFMAERLVFFTEGNHSNTELFELYDDVKERLRQQEQEINEKCRDDFADFVNKKVAKNGPDMTRWPYFQPSDKQLMEYIKDVKIWDDDSTEKPNEHG